MSPYLNLAAIAPDIANSVVLLCLGSATLVFFARTRKRLESKARSAADDKLRAAASRQG